MEHLENEVRLGSMLGVMQDDANRTIGVLRALLHEISSEMDAYKQQCIDEGIDFANDARYRRYHHLYTMFGGIYYCMQGSCGMMSGLVTDLLSDIKI